MQCYCSTWGLGVSIYVSFKWPELKKVLVFCSLLGCVTAVGVFCSGSASSKVIAILSDLPSAGVILLIFYFLLSII